MYLTDFHIHSNFSDGRHPIPEIVDLYGSRGFGAIAITDHLCEEKTWMGKAAKYVGYTLTPINFNLYQEILRSEAKRAWEEYGMVLIPGLEITKNSLRNHRAAHILALGVTDWVSADLPVEKIIEEIHSQEGLAIAAHPVPTGKIEIQTCLLWNRRDELKGLIDAWEGATRSQIFSSVLKSDLPILANSDFHHRRHLNSWKTLLNCERNTFSIFDAIRRQDLDIEYYQEEKDYAGSHLPNDGLLGTFGEFRLPRDLAHW